MKGFNANQVTQILYAAHINGLTTIYKMLQVALRRDCPAILEQLKQEQKAVIKKKEETKASAVINQLDHAGCTALYIACEQGHLTLVKKFLKFDHIDIDLRNGDGQTPLNIACEKGYLDIVKLLIEHGAKINQEDVDIARQKGHQAIVNLLIEYQKKQVAIN